MGRLRTAAPLRFRSLASGDILRRRIQGQGTETGDLESTARWPVIVRLDFLDVLRCPRRDSVAIYGLVFFFCPLVKISLMATVFPILRFNGKSKSGEEAAQLVSQLLCKGLRSYWKGSGDPNGFDRHSN